MTNKEIMVAIGNINEVLSSEFHLYDFSWLRTAKEALEKQIPRKPVKEGREIVCPACQTLVGSRPYCGYCGQSIDWHAYEDEEGRR